MKKISTVQVFGNEIFKEQKLTIGVDLGDRWSFYCVLDEAGKIILEQKLPTTPEVMKQTFSRIPQSRIALETGTHSPWASRLLRELPDGAKTPGGLGNRRRLRLSRCRCTPGSKTAFWSGDHRAFTISQKTSSSPRRGSRVASRSIWPPC